ncbi:MAG: glycosyltransferase 87 family protein, partial [Deltaproteobacteria bacterium]
MPSPPGEPAVETGRRTLARDWDRLAPWIVAGVLALFAILHVVRHGGDFFTYWRAAQRFLAGAPQYPASDGLGTYRYSPGVLLLLAPFTLVPVAAGRTIWFLLVVLSGAWVARRLVRGLPSPLAGTAVLVGFLGVSRPFLDEFFYGQADWLVLALLVAALTAEDRRRDLLAGLLV